jgi:hypothetical protein
VEHTDKPLSIPDLVLLIISAAGGVVNGRTVVQKLGYFAGLAMGRDLGHQAHYYGPYSRPVEAALVNETFAGDLQETVERFTAWSGPEVRQYTYTLTPQGEKVVEEITTANPQTATRVKDIVGQLVGLVPGLPQQSLSLAAKVDFILAASGGEAQVEDIPALAREHGWQVTEDDVQSAAAILRGLGRIATPAATP